MSLNQDMTKFTSVKDYNEYRAFFSPLLSSLGEIGEFMDLFIFYCFNKYVELKENNFQDIIPNVKQIIADVTVSEDVKDKIFRCDVETLNKVAKEYWSKKYVLDPVALELKLEQIKVIVDNKPIFQTIRETVKYE